MKTKLFASLPVLSLLAACGGGGGSSTSVGTLWESPMGTGAGLVRATTDGANSVALVSNVNDAGQYKTRDVVEVISETNNFDGSYTGEVVLRDSDGNIENALGRFYGTANYYIISDGEDMKIVAGGDEASAMPIGTYRYSGYAETIYVYDSSEYNETGSFVMDVQFASKSAELNATASESQYINNNLRINNAGELSGKSGTFIVYASDGVTELERRTIGFDGTFHGSGATHVSGIGVGGSTTNDDLSVVGIVGKR